MQKFNLHTHTMRCGHAIGLDEQYIKAAIQAEFTMIGISDHIPYKDIYKSGDRMKFEEVDEYLDSFKDLNEKYKDKINIKIGFEAEYLEDREDEIFYLRSKCDYLILGQHCKYMGYDYDYYSSDEDVLDYVKAIETALSKGIYTYLAHPDYFMLGRRSYDKVCEEAAHRIAQACIKNKTPIEINLNKLKKTDKIIYYNSIQDEYEEAYPYPFKEFWKVISQYNCDVVYGYDAHSPTSLLERYREEKANEILKELNLNFIDSIELK